jgi:hypothetical protein
MKDDRDFFKPLTIDWEMNMANSIVSQILNNEHCKKDYAKILAIAMLKINHALKSEKECEHEVGDTYYVKDSNIIERCKKCGELYR